MNYTQAITACLCLLLCSVLTLTMRGMGQGWTMDEYHEYLELVHDYVVLDTSCSYQGYGTVDVSNDPTYDVPGGHKAVDHMDQADEVFWAAIEAMNNNSTKRNDDIPEA